MANDNRNLGIPNTSRSSALGPTKQGPDLQSLLEGTSFGQTLSRAQSAGQRAEAIQDQEEPSLLQRLISPGGLALLAGTLAAGGAAGGAGALAFGSGALPQLAASVQEEKEDRAAAVQALLKERDDALNLAEKSMNRFTTILNSNPEALGGIDENLLGALATGEAIRLNPTARRKASRVDDQQKKRHEFLMEGIKNTKTVEDTRTIIRQIFANQDWHNPPTEVIDALARNIGTPDINSTLANIGAEHGGSSFQSAVVAAGEMGVGLEHPDVFSLIDWNESEEESLVPSQQEALRVLELDDEITTWTSNPDNREKLAQFRAETGEDEIAFQKAVLDEVLAGRGGDFNIYVNARKHLARAGNWSAFNTAWVESGGPFALADAILSADPKFRKMNPEQKLRYRAETAFQTFKSMLDSVNETNAFDDATSLNNATQKFLEQIPNLDSGRAQQLAREAIIDATDQTGRVDKQIFNQLLGIIIEQELDSLKGK